MISIIIPVYNAERTLRRCVDSVLAQTYEAWECILVDDGSKDASPAICDEYAIQDSRIRVIHKENGGVSSARNAGLEVVMGAWITFLDSDDRFSKEHLAVLYSAWQSTQSDLVCVGAQFFGDSSYYIGYDVSKKWDIQKDDISDLLGKYCFGTPWAKLFKSSIVKSFSIRFPEDLIIAEDSCFVWRYISHIASIHTCSALTYLYWRDNDRPNPYYMPLENCEKHRLFVGEELLRLSKYAVNTDFTALLENQNWFFFSLYLFYVIRNRVSVIEFRKKICGYKCCKTMRFPSNLPRGLRLCNWLIFRVPALGFFSWRLYYRCKFE